MKKLTQKSINLLKFVEEGMNNNKSKLTIFSEYALKYHLLKESVRNYYYLAVQVVQANEIYAQNCGINPKLHKIDEIIEFSKDDLKSQMKEIICYKLQGMSLRKSCFLVAKNDIKLALRLQNKYRNLLKKNPQFLQNISNSIERNNENLTKLSLIKNEKVLFFPTQTKSKISDKDITNLFMGLVRLIKNNAQENLSKDLKSENEKINKDLNLSLIELNSKERKIKALEAENLGLKIKLEKALSSLAIKYKENKNTILNNNSEFDKFIDELKGKTKSIKKKLTTTQQQI